MNLPKLVLELGNLEENIRDFKPNLFVKGFDSKASDLLTEFFFVLLNPLCGAHRSYGALGSLVKIFHQGKEINPNKWTHRFDGDDGYYRDVNAIKAAISENCSFVFDQYYRYNDFAKYLATLFGAYFKCVAGCNAYLSQLGSVARPLHRD